MNAIRRAAIAAALALASTVAVAADSSLGGLPRKAQLGVALPTAAQSPGGATVGEVLAGGTAAAMGVQPGDVIVRAGDRPIANADEVIAYAAGLVGGAPVALTVRRGTSERILRGRALPRPLEQHEGATSDYGAVPWRGGQLRDLLVTPGGAAAPPIVFLIQGFSCSTIENPLFRQLAAELLRAGIGFYRVEKPGIGDSAGTPHCSTIDYGAELDAFRTAYRHLIERRGIAPDRIFMLGHSLGGMQAPMLAAERAPRGVAVYGTVLRNWADYHRNIDQFQSYLMTGADLAAQTERTERHRDIFRRFYLLREAPAQVAAADPILAEGMREAMNWDGGDNIFGRHFKYAQDLAHLPLIAAWRDTRSNVLSLYGASDMVALDDEDHRLIADLVNFHRPGTASYVEIARTGHGMELLGDRQEVRARARAGGPPQPAPFNPEVARALIAWVQASMARPPVQAAAS